MSKGRAMSGAANSETRVTLLQRLRSDPADPQAWAEFVDHYGGKVLGWCRTWGLQEADAQDVTQDVLLSLARRMKDFAYDPSKSFHAWLKTVARHAWLAFVNGRRRPGVGSGDSGVLDQLLSVAARDDLLKRLEEAFDHELLEEAVRRVRLRVEPRTWEAFRLTAEEGLSGAEAAARTGLRVSQVYVAKKRVQDMLRQEIQALDPGA
jgi:RNA polymerase sigma-70 factor (ECF subfamily)